MSNNHTGGQGFVIALITMMVAGALKASGKKVSWWWILLPIPIYFIAMLSLSAFIVLFSMLLKGG